VEGHHPGAVDDVKAALADLEVLLKTHAAPTQMTSGILTADVRDFAGLS
jgi:hypothetical protein